MKPEDVHGPSRNFVYQVIRKRVPLFATVFALLFTIIAIAQYLFVRHGVYKVAHHQMRQWSEQVAAEIGYKTNWDLTAYRQSASVQAPSTLVFTSDGIIIETKGFIPGLLGKVKLIDESVFEGSKDVKVAETGETWKELAVKVNGGFVVFGILNFREINAPDELLHATARKFGSSIEDALNVRTGQTSSEVDFAIIDDSGNLLFAAEGLPLKTNPNSLVQLANAGGTFRSGDKLYLLLSRPIVDSFGNAVGTIIIPRDITGDDRVIHQHITFNATITLAAWLSALLIVVVYLGLEDWRQRPEVTSLEEALRQGESQTVEFKKGLPDNALAAAIAAFANTNTGTIFLGVDDNCQVVGVACETPERKDEELKRVRLIASDKIKPGVLIRPDFVSHEGKVVMRIFCSKERTSSLFAGS